MPIYRQRPIYLFIGHESKEHLMTDGMKEMRGQCNCEWIYVLHNFMTKQEKSVKLCSTSVLSFTNGGILSDY